MFAKEAMASHVTPCGLVRCTGGLAPSEASLPSHRAAAGAAPRLSCRAMRTPRRAGQRPSPHRLAHRLPVPPHPRVFRRTAVDEQNGSSSSSTMTRDSAGNASEESSKDSTTTGSSAEGAAEASKAADSSKPITKDVLALRSLDAYFEKLDEPKKREAERKRKEEEEAAAAVAAANAAALAEAGSSIAGNANGVKTDAKSEGSKQGKAEDEDIVSLLKNLGLDVKTVEAAPGEKGKEDGPQWEVSSPTTFGVQSEYQRWLDAQQLIQPPSALNILLAINVAVFLFELASPEAVPGLIVTSLPSLLGAKVNTLIAAGEWWRLVTPMFLHAGFFHILLGSVVLLSLGPSVEIAFGSFGFFAAYFTGGVYGNLMSFWETAEVTVGGTGPIYGILAAYLVYLYRNRQAIGKEEAESSLWSLIFFGALNIAIGSALPIDDWTHIGAVVGGLLFGVLASPELKRLPIGFSKEESTNNKEGSQGQATGTEGAPATPTSGTDSSSSNKPSEVEAGGTLFLLERLGPKRQAWIMAACLGVAALLLQFSTTGIPDSLAGVTSQISSI